MNIWEEIISLLDDKKKTVATMESCTDGGVASEITNHLGASEVLKFSAVTYSNEFKIKMGVSESVINAYSVYSIETAVEMAKNISLFSGSDYGVGITGKINTPDPANPTGDNDFIFITIFDKEQDKCYKFELNADHRLDRKQNKERIIAFIGKQFLQILQ